jgi:poly-gamma-glutamate synthesis protein (capsule biosynthesis protein)
MRLALAVIAVAVTVALPVGATAAEPTDSPTVRLMAVGDLMLAGGIGARIVNDGAGAPWLGVAPDLATADLVVANLECTVSSRGTKWPKRNTFRAPVTAADSIVWGGIDIVHVANNHALDYGPTAFADTLRLLDERGVAHVGGGRDRASARAPVILERNGLRVAFLGYILPNAGLKPWYPGLWNATRSRAGLAVGTPETVAADIASVLASADVVVVSFHGGMEHRAAQSAQVIQFAQAAISAGAALVIGHHPALLQGYHSNGTTLEAFSLGRFVSDRGSWPSRDSAILDVTLSAEGVQSFGWIPIVIEQGFPRPAKGTEVDRIMARLKEG